MRQTSWFGVVRFRRELTAEALVVRKKSFFAKMSSFKCLISWRQNLQF